MNNAELTELIRAMAPWHHDVEVNPELSTGKVFSPSGKLPPRENDQVSLRSPRRSFERQSRMLFPDGLDGKRFLDCACNAGAFCFYARELGADFAFGFDVRSHWIEQATFVQQHRRGFPSDRIEFRQMDLCDLPEQGLAPFDFTYFSGLFYHLPDPIAGLKAAADLTKDILVLNTAAVADTENPLGLTLALESQTKVMSGVHTLAWFPNGPEVLNEILTWLGFKEVKLTRDVRNEHSRRRVELVAARTAHRLDGLEGELLSRRPRPT